MANYAFINGQVITVDQSDRICQAVLVEGAHIKAVGTSAEIAALVNDSVEVIDLQGRTLIPGFIDAHNHLTHQGAAFATVDFGYPAVSSIADLRDAVGHAAENCAPGQWIRGWGMNYEKFSDGRIPTRWDLDDISPDNPVCIVHVSGHNVLVNSIALALAGVDDNTPDPSGGMFVRDEQGRITGYAYDSAQQLVIPTSVDVGHHGPDIGYDLPLEELVDDIDRACKAYLKVGITSIVDPQVTTREMPGYMEARKQGKLTVKTTCMYLSNHQDAINELGITDHIGNDLLSIGPMKYYCDGALIGGTALFYADEPQGEQGCKCNKSAGRGYTYWPDVEAFKEALIDTHRRGMQFGVHTQGDMAMDIVLDAIEEAHRRFPRSDTRHRIEHCHGPSREQVARIRRLGVIPVTQPGQLEETGDDLTHIYGERRAKRFCPLRDMLDEGIPAVVSTDAFVQSYKPFDAISAAVNRRSLTGRDMGQEQRISVLEAIRAYTWNAAYSVYHETRKGSVEVGKLADLVVIDADFLSVPLDEISRQQVLMTLSSGEIVYRK
ncbi:amidohydrolase [Marinobacterium rhizophilum]|uniref:Amidohydrolase n=1 Tax=Marinobacterium rhizophilum TaxID=420402 RepID=A0ABY5HJ70_9GAMM|nr:amidohydrolase [Marinobacterium rhizophilum]UTW11857.1 amidohydrolase [Marinobacterium rhizophilum]